MYTIGKHYPVFESFVGNTHVEQTKTKNVLQETRKEVRKLYAFLGLHACVSGTTRVVPEIRKNVLVPALTM